MLARRLVLGSAAMAALSVLTVLVLWVVTSAREPAAPAPPSTSSASSAHVERPGRAERVDPPEALAVLDGWDSRRARAWAAGDVVALGALYVEGSRTGRRDVAMLRAYVARGLTVRGLRMQVLGVRVLSRRPAVMALSVTDRMRGAVAVAAGRRVVLPADRATTREVTLRRVGGAWLVAEARG